MNRMKKTLALLLAVAMLSCMLCGCESKEEQMKKVVGTWALSIEAEESLREKLLEYIGMTDAELPLLMELTFTYDALLIYNEDGTFHASADAESMRDAVRDYFDDAFDMVYDNCSVLEDAYGYDLSDVTRGEFFQACAEGVGFSDYEEMIEYFANNCFDYEAFGEDFSRGTYSVKGKRIIMEDQIGNFNGEVDFKLEGDTLSLAFGNGTEVYTRK